MKLKMELLLYTLQLVGAITADWLVLMFHYFQLWAIRTFWSGSLTAKKVTVMSTCVIGTRGRHVTMQQNMGRVLQLCNDDVLVFYC